MIDGLEHSHGHDLGQDLGQDRGQNSEHSHEHDFGQDLEQKPEQSPDRHPEQSQLAGALEAMLFVTDEPVSVLSLAKCLEAQPREVEAALEQLSEQLATENRGIQLREVAGGWRLLTHPAYNDIIEKYVLSWDTRKLSAAAMETLAIVAYTQPVTRSAVAQVRGVNSDSAISSLVEKGLVCERGQADTPGNPTLYGTTRTFLEKFGLRSVADLPPVEEFALDAETRRLIRERLSATREDAEVSEDAARLMAEEMLEDTSEEVEEAMNQALSSAFGLVEKIDFSTIQINMDDE